MVTCAVFRKNEVIPSSGMVGKSLLSFVFLNKLCKIGFICALEHDQVSSILTLMFWTNFQENTERTLKMLT